MPNRQALTPPYKEPRPEGVYYGPPYNDPPGSMLWYRNVYRLRHEIMKCWSEYPEGRPVECINFVRTELCYPPDDGDKREDIDHA